MSDDVRRLFAESLESIPIPVAPIGVARRRGRRLLAGRLAVGLMVVLAAAAAMSVLRDRGGDGRTGPAEVGESTVDATALRLIDDLGPLCNHSYDFLYKAELGGEIYRPVQCGLVTVVPALRRSLGASSSPTRSPSVSPTPASREHLRIVITKAPTLVVYAFEDSRSRDYWLDRHPSGLGGRVGGRRWVVDVMDVARFGDVRAALAGDGGRVIAMPAREELVRGRVLARVGPDFRPRVSLRRASRPATRLEQHEILGAQLVSYARRAGEDARPAWTFIFRRCIPVPEELSEPHFCVGDQRFVVVDARSARVIDSFFTGPSPTS